MCVCVDWIHTDVKGGTVGPSFGHRVKSITVLKALLPAGIRPSNNIEFVVQGADTLKEGEQDMSQKQTNLKSVTERLFYSSFLLEKNC